MSIFDYNGSAVLAMSGKECVAIGSDLRLGAQNLTVATDFKKVFKIHDKLYVGLSGLGTDVLTLKNLFTFKHNLYKLKEERNIRPTTFNSYVASTLYEKRFSPYFVAPIIAGLNDDGTPFLSSMDPVGMADKGDNFVMAGTMPEALMGVCESFWKPDMNPDELFEVAAQCLLIGIDRDALSGWGAIIHIITKDRVITKTLKGRMD